MQKQKDMEKSMMSAHRGFVTNMEKSLDLIEKELDDASEMTQVCTDEWCRSTECFLDDIHKQIYSISEPRFSSEADSDNLKKLRTRVKDLYVNFKGISNKS